MASWRCLHVLVFRGLEPCIFAITFFFNKLKTHLTNILHCTMMSQKPEMNYVNKIISNMFEKHFEMPFVACLQWLKLIPTRTARQ